MKYVLISLLALLSTYSFSAQEALVESSEDSRVLRELRDIRSDLEQRRSQMALDKVNHLIRSLEREPHERTYSSTWVVYSTTNTNFRCDYRQERNAIQRAENSAIQKCYEDGAKDCLLLNSMISKNGYLGTINGNYYGYGCQSDAIVRGTF